MPEKDSFFRAEVRRSFYLMPEKEKEKFPTCFCSILLRLQLEVRSCACPTALTTSNATYLTDKVGKTILVDRRSCTNCIRQGLLVDFSRLPTSQRSVNAA